MTKKLLKLFVPLFALMFVMGALVSGAAAAEPSGAVSFSVVAAPDSTRVNGDPVNFVIQTLDANGNINTLSNGQVGDVLFSVTTSIGTYIWPTGGVGSSVNGGLGRGEFDAVTEANLQPKAGLVFGSIYYDDATAGLDTATFRMYKSTITGSGETVAGDQIGAPQIFHVDVAGPTVTGITAITDVTVENALASGAAQVDTLTGGETNIKVTATGTGIVTVEFVGIAKADGFGNNAAGTTVSVDVGVTNGFGFGTLTFTKAGYYQIQASAGDVSFVKLQPAATAQDLVGRQYALYARPNAPTQLALTLQKPVVGIGGSGTSGTVKRLDANGNASGWTATGADAAEVPVALSASTTNVDLTLTSPTILAGDASANLPTNITGLAAGSAAIQASAAPELGLASSAGVTLYVGADLFLTAEIDDGSGTAVTAGTVVRGPGQVLRVINITSTATLAGGNPVSLKLGSFSLSSALDAAGAGVFSATFILPTKALGPVPAIFTLDNRTVGSYLLGTTAEGDTPVQIVPGGGSVVKLVNPNGFDLAGYNANFSGRTFNIPGTQGGLGAHFMVADQYGNNVPFATSNLTGTLSSSNLTPGSYVVNLGTDQNSDAVLNWPTSFSGTDTITLTPNTISGTPAPITFDVANVGTKKLAAIAIEPAATETLGNSLIPVVIETLDNTGKRIGANVIITVQQATTVSVMRFFDGFGDASGTRTINGRDVFALDTGNVQGDVIVKVQSTDGAISDEATLTVAINEGPIVGPVTPIGQTAGEVSVTADENLELFVPERASDAVSEYFAFAGVVSGFSTPVYVLSSTRGVVPVDQFDPLADRYSYQADNSTGLILTMGSLNLKAGDQFLYAYVYIDPQGEIVVGDPVIVNIVAP
jgi:hypothetical protein